MKTNKVFFSLCWWWNRGFGSGLSPRAPGTAGSVLGIGLGVGVALNMEPFWGLLVWFAYGIISWVFLRWELNQERTNPDFSVNDQDRGEFVSDEILGLGLAFWLAWQDPFRVFDWPWLAVIMFILFRFFDVLKPGPIGLLDKRLTGPIGILMDDVLAGFIAAGVGHGGSRLWMWFS